MSRVTAVLIGGGWDYPDVYGPFLDGAGRNAVVACVVVDGGAAEFARWAAALQAARPCRPVPVLVPRGAALDTDALGDADALLVCGGLTPAYANALAPAAAAVRAWLSSGRPYAGFSAGAALAADHAVVGGYRLGARVVCPADAAEGLEEVTVVDGLGLVDFGVDVHAAQWGTVGRLIAAVASRRVARGVAIDEDTALVIDADGVSVIGHGAVHVVRRTKGGIHVDVVAALEPLSLAHLA